MSKEEIRQLKLKQFKAIYEDKKRMPNILYSVIIPLTITIIVSTREEIRNAIANPFVSLINAVQTSSGKFIALIISLVFLWIFFYLLTRKLVPKFFHWVEKENATSLQEYIGEIEGLITEAEKEGKKVS